MRVRSFVRVVVAVSSVVVVGALPNASAAQLRGAAPNNVQVTIAGTGSGKVIGTGGFWAEYECPSECQMSYYPNSSGVLTAQPSKGSVFGGFMSVGCASPPPGPNQCAFNIGTGTLYVTAYFNDAPPGSDEDACADAKSDLAKAKEKLSKLRSDDASDEKIDAAKRKVKKAKKAVKKACAS